MKERKEIELLKEKPEKLKQSRISLVLTYIRFLPNIIRAALGYTPNKETIYHLFKKVPVPVRAFERNKDLK